MGDSTLLSVTGKRTHGEPIRTQNGTWPFFVCLISIMIIIDNFCTVFKLKCIHASVTAAAAIANIVKSSLGPVGLDKMLVDDVGVSIFVLYILFGFIF